MFGSYDGLTLEPASALSNISSLISAVRIIGLMEGESYKGINSELMEIAHEYAMAASDTRFLTPQKSNAALATSSPTPFGPFYYPTTETLGDRIRALREERELSRTNLADTIDVPRSLMWKWEDNEVCPSDDQLDRLAKELNCDPYWLRTGDSRPVPAENSQATCEPETTIGERIREMRKLRDLSPNQLAHLLGVKPKAISMWELNFSSPACNRLMGLANALNCDPMWLLTGQDNAGQPADALSHASLQR